MILVDEIHVKHIAAVCFDAMKIALLERFFFWVRDSSSNLRTPYKQRMLQRALLLRLFIGTPPPRQHELGSVLQYQQCLDFRLGLYPESLEIKACW